jgi:transcriptional regulator NrdR family protein
VKCPECGAPAFVHQTRSKDASRMGLPNGKTVVLRETRRRHHCSNAACACRFTTLEQVVRDHTYRHGKA